MNPSEIMPKSAVAEENILEQQLKSQEITSEQGAVESILENNAHVEENLQAAQLHDGEVIQVADLIKREEKPAEQEKQFNEHVEHDAHNTYADYKESEEPLVSGEAGIEGIEDEPSLK